MTDKLKDWDTTAANNNSTPPNGWPENMAPSDVNNSARQGMASVAEWYDDAEWLHYGHTASAYTSTTLTISGDVTAKYVAGRKIRLDQDNSKVAKVESSSYSAPNTTVTVSGYTIAALPSIVELHLVSNDDYLPIIPPEYPTGYLTGCRLLADTDGDHDIQVSTGGARDATDAANITLASVITKQIDAVWAEGDDAGGFPSGVNSGSPAASTWYYFFLIAKTDGTVDAGFDSSSTAANLLSDASTYTYYRHIGSILTDASSNIDKIVSIGLLGVMTYREAFTSSGTFTWPPGVESIDVTVVGADGTNSGAGGDTTFVYNTTTFTGEGGGTSAAGGGSGGDINLTNDRNESPFGLVPYGVGVVISGTPYGGGGSRGSIQYDGTGSATVTIGAAGSLGAGGYCLVEW